jgi:hypothetical protein
VYSVTVRCARVCARGEVVPSVQLLFEFTNEANVDGAGAGEDDEAACGGD